MSIKLNIRGGLSVIAKGKQLFEVNGKTVGECLDQLISLVPALKETIFYETRQGLAIRSSMQVKVNRQVVYTEDLVKEVKDSDVIQIKKTVQ